MLLYILLKFKYFFNKFVIFSDLFTYLPNFRHPLHKRFFILLCYCVLLIFNVKNIAAQLMDNNDLDVVVITSILSHFI